ncbi:MAG: universal stress protein [Candidatus Bathyarchaeia archaeon]
MFAKILVPIDGSPHADKAIRYAADLSKRYGSRLILLHVIPVRVYAFAEVGAVLSEDVEEGEEILRRGMELARSLGAEADQRLRRGIPAEEILRAAEEEKVDLIAIGSRGLSGVKAFLLGSVSDKVSHHAKCPVFIVR